MISDIFNDEMKNITEVTTYSISSISRRLVYLNLVNGQVKYSTMPTNIAKLAIGTRESQIKLIIL